ncbi:hypothetical protein HOLleu_39386 [Holothuria leucospilota]|uniref:BRICHOS domain-containing protein n=1 Tax=Holothuria leucospilota TaxID=206669 RepID=A0A9Q0YGG5_HOLLE|nr:hypothetical protein HOLleu_39386 [Holothuria leucospilota]
MLQYFWRLIEGKRMKPTTGSEMKKQGESETAVPIQTMVPVIPMQTSQKYGRLFIVIILFSLLVLAAAVVVVWTALKQRGSYYQAVDDLEESYLGQNTGKKQNFDIRIDIGGEKCVESVHTDEGENIVTFRYTGENGRAGDTAVYDFNQGVAAVRNSNETVCFFTNAYYLPVFDLGKLQLSARNKEVLEVGETVQLQIKGIIPHGFLETIGGPIFTDLCRSVPSYWLAEITAEETDRMKRGAGNLSISISVPAGGSAAIIVLGGPGSDSGTFEIILG